MTSQEPGSRPVSSRRWCPPGDLCRTRSFWSNVTWLEKNQRGFNLDSWFTAASLVELRSAPPLVETPGLQVWRSGDSPGPWTPGLMVWRSPGLEVLQVVSWFINGVWWRFRSSGAGKRSWFNSVKKRDAADSDHDEDEDEDDDEEEDKCSESEWQIQTLI